MTQIKNRPITLGQKTRELITTKLNIFRIGTQGDLWQWQEGAKDTLNPFPAMQHTLNEIWNKKIHWYGGTWRQTDNPHHITDDTELNFLNKIFNSWEYVLKPLLDSRGIYWRQSDGHGSYGSTFLKIWTLTHYRTHTEWDILNTHRHEWESKKSIFSKYWSTSNHTYVVSDMYGCEEEYVSEEKYHDSLDEQQRLQDESESECEGEFHERF